MWNYILTTKKDIPILLCLIIIAKVAELTASITMVLLFITLIRLTFFTDFLYTTRLDEVLIFITVIFLFATLLKQLV